MKPLNFNDEEQAIINDLTYISAVWQVEEEGLTWDDIKLLFPESAENMKKRYMEENWE